MHNQIYSKRISPEIIEDIQRRTEKLRDWAARQEQAKTKAATTTVELFPIGNTQKTDDYLKHI